MMMRGFVTGIFAFLAIVRAGAAETEAIPAAQILRDRLLVVTPGQLVSGCITRVGYAPASPLREEVVVESVTLDGLSFGKIDVAVRSYVGIVSIGDCFHFRVIGPSMFSYPGHTADGYFVGEIVSKVPAVPVVNSLSAQTNEEWAKEYEVSSYFVAARAVGVRKITLTGQVSEIVETLDRRSILIVLADGHGCEVSSYYDLENLKKDRGQFELISKIQPGNVVDLRGHFMMEQPCFAIFKTEYLLLRK